MSGVVENPALRFPIREEWVSLAGGRMRYLRAGPQNGASALLLIHGLLGYSFSWRFNVPALAEHAAVYAVDLPGVGFSERSKKLDCSLRGAAGRLLQFMDERGLASADVLGTSHGGALAMMMAALGGAQRVRRLVLVAPVHPWSAQGRLTIQLLASAAGGALLRRGAPLLRPLHGYFLRRMYGDPRRVPPGTVEGYSAALAIPGTADYLVRVLKCWKNDLAALESALPALAQLPTLLIWGSRDGAVPPSSAEALRQRLGQARLVILEGAGHLPYEECPQEFNRAVLEFLTTPQGAD